MGGGEDLHGASVVARDHGPGGSESEPRLKPLFDVGQCVWVSNGYWDEAAEGSVRDATRVTRAQARAGLAFEFGWTETGVWKRYVWVYSQQDAWDEYGSERWVEEWMDEHAVEVVWHPERKDQGDEWTHANADTGEPIEVPNPPEHPPEGWYPDEGEPGWQFVHPSHPKAQPAWIVGWVKDGPPQKPSRPKRLPEPPGPHVGQPSPPVQHNSGTDLSSPPVGSDG